MLIKEPRKCNKTFKIGDKKEFKSNWNNRKKLQREVQKLSESLALKKWLKSLKDRLLSSYWDIIIRKYRWVKETRRLESDRWLEFRKNQTNKWEIKSNFKISSSKGIRIWNGYQSLLRGMKYKNTNKEYSNNLITNLSKKHSQITK